MEVQGASLINTDFFAKVVAELTAAKTPEQLQALVTQHVTSILAVQTAITAQLAAFAPALSLLTMSFDNIDEIKDFLVTLKTAVITPLLQPAIVLASELTAQTAQIAAIEATVASLATQFPGSVITLP